MGPTRARSERRRTWAQWVTWLVLVIGILISVAASVTRYYVMAPSLDGSLVDGRH